MISIKQMFSSKTVNFGLLMSLVGIAAIYVESLNNPFLTMISGFIVVVLRFVTTQALEEKS